MFVPPQQSQQQQRITVETAADLLWYGDGGGGVRNNKENREQCLRRSHLGRYSHYQKHHSLALSASWYHHCLFDRRRWLRQLQQC